MVAEPDPPFYIYQIPLRMLNRSPNSLCTQEIMFDPVITSDGHSYERGAIERWFLQGKVVSPVTNVALQSNDLTPNITLRKGKSATPCQHQYQHLYRRRHQ